MVTMILVGLTLLLLGATLVSYLRHKRFQGSRVHMGLLIHMFFCAHRDYHRIYIHLLNTESARSDLARERPD
ncbi:hypothetical protein [Alkalicoccus luteus]|uniref:Uncharacterized protein n=1 Tax=Alkalicoccus luteus TaxID=1237094 RepID=A0A969PSL3_9BACI|nr:hypothetical protein [Alkalicoccus luteus]NJP38324.1 hypothetical protein [Alkalicoccus luteus]